jgi:RNA polymerase sigma factor (sigma-70 family)
MEASRAVPPPRPRTSLRQLPPLRLKREAGPTFEQLYRRHAQEVYQYALALLTNPADAEDVTQTTFLNAYRAYERGERPRKPHNWLIAIAHNVCRMRWRQAGARPREVALDEAPEPSTLDQERPDLELVLTALARLSFNQRAALVMRELEGRSYQEIAEVLGVTVSAVEALLFRARRRLQVHRKALGVLTTVPLPSSLSSFLGGAGGGAVAAGGAAVVLKAVAVVAAGALATGAGVEGIRAVKEATSAPAQAASQLASPGQRQAAAWAQEAAAGMIPGAGSSELRGATPGERMARLEGMSPSADVQLPGAAASVPGATTAVGAVPGVGVAAAPVAAPAQTPVSLPSTGTVPAPAPPSVSVPPAPVPPAPVPPAPVPQTPLPPAPPVPQAPLPPAPPLPDAPAVPATPALPALPVPVLNPQLPPLPPLK